MSLHHWAGIQRWSRYGILVAFVGVFLGQLHSGFGQTDKPVADSVNRIPPTGAGDSKALNAKSPNKLPKDEAAHQKALNYRSKGPPTESRTWNSRGLGGLIEGRCLGVEGDKIRIEVGNVERAIPFELFHENDLALIRAHFSMPDPFPPQATTDPAPRSDCKMLHTIRGGVLPSAKVVGHEGNVIHLADADGLLYRVPFALFAEGVRGSVRDAITILDGKPFAPVDDAQAIAKPAAAPTPGRSPMTPPMANRPKTPPRDNSPPKVANSNRPRPGQVVTPPPPPPPTSPALPTPSVSPMPTAPKPPEMLKPLGEERVWTMRGGKISWRGRFLALEPPAVKILTTEGQTRSIPLPLLEDRDRAYAESLAKNGRIGEAPAGALVLANEDAEFISPSEGRPFFIRDGRKIVPLDNRGQPMTKVVTLSDSFRLFRLHEKYWVAATEKEIHLLDRATLSSKKKIELWKYKRINDLAPHPTRPLCVVSVEQVADHVRKNPAENQRIVVVDLETDKIHEPEEAYGMWLRMHPSGNYVLAGFHAAFKSGPDEEFDATGRLVPRLNVEHIDVLNRFRIEGVQLALDQQFENAGTNGQRLAMSANGERVCYLSYTGYPTLSYQIQALSSGDFEQKPVTFATKDRSDCKRLVFHGNGELAASPTVGGAIIFDAKTGREKFPSVLSCPELEGALIHDLAFSRDGSQLLFLASKDGSPLFLQSVALLAGVR
ncbi:MAG: hypothetical protein U1A77_15965 [Pirellulales bacterium]